MTDVSTNDPVPTAPAAVDSSGEDPSSVATRQTETRNRVAEISALLSALEDAATESGLAASRPPEPPAALPEKAVHSATALKAASADAALPGTAPPDAAPPDAAPHTVAPPDTAPPDAAPPDGGLIEARLKVASSLFEALRHKHAPTAGHSLRVALGCSSWALSAELDEETQDVVELAALMHDIGKMAVPDNILLKTTRLTSEEKSLISRHREIGLEILSGCCGSARILNAVRYAGLRFDGQGSGPAGLPVGEEIPLEARMIAIVDAFDAMTTDHVYRPAKSRERALGELFEFAGTQFDPVLVKQFVQALSERHDALITQVASRWLGEIAQRASHLPWAVPSAEAARPAAAAEVPVGGSCSLFEQKLIDAMHDGVVFVDAQARITLWSEGAERLTGVSSAAVLSRVFAPSLLDMCDHQGSRKVVDKACPVAKALLTNTQLRHRTLVMGRRGKHVAVDLHAIPVQADDGTVQGATVLLHDAQPEASLEEKCEALHAEVTKDPMTKVANRAEFDRMFALYVEAHQQADQPCSLIMIGIYHLKNINDTSGHQSGDEAIITLANLLRSMCRAGDMVARYGGEEFAVLCADCSNADGARRTEQFRKKLSEVSHSALGNKRITASFGVTELQAGDTPETMLRRSDRALLMAKEQGRNQVIQLGNGMDKEQPKKKWWNWRRLRNQPVVQSSLTSAVPIDIAIEKLRGFVSDHEAKIVLTRENMVEMEVSSESISYDRRKADRRMIFRVELQFSEKRVERTNSAGFAGGEHVDTLIDLKISPKRIKRSRRSDMAERARLIQQSIKAYLMAKDAHETQAEYTLTHAR